MSELPELLVPYGCSERGPMVHARDALRSNRYTCPECATVLVLRAIGSEHMRQHFAHPTPTTCDGETVIHATAKRLLAEAIERSASDAASLIRLQGHCCDCGGPYVAEIGPGVFTGAAVEYTQGAFRCDVMGLHGDAPRLALEVLHAHATSDIKASALGVPMVELRASEVLDDPRAWRPVRETLKPRRCEPCRALRAECEALGLPAESVSVARKDAGWVPYVAARIECWACREQIPVFWWLGVPFCQEAPPEPRPRTVQWRMSKQWGGKYWANTCPHKNCKAIQGDNHLFLFDHAPFAGLEMNRGNFPPNSVPDAQVTPLIPGTARHAITRMFSEHVETLRSLEGQSQGGRDGKPKGR